MWYTHTTRLIPVFNTGAASGLAGTAWPVCIISHSADHSVGANTVLFAHSVGLGGNQSSIQSTDFAGGHGF
jgi:hypothetical protein